MAVYCYITFPTVYFAMQAEASLAGKPYQAKLVPVPRVISSSCGTALRCSCREAQAITQILTENKVEFGSVHHLADPLLK